MTDDKRVVVTGAAGFIGMHLVENLLKKNYEVIGIDNFQPSYGGTLCELRQRHLETEYHFEIQRIDISDQESLKKLATLFENAYSVIHLAAWPGVRQGQVTPHEYSLANLTGFSNILESVRLSKPRQFMFASSSSIYGDLGVSGPVKESAATGLNLRSYYATTKWTNEMLAQQHFKISGVPTLALRFFTVYGEFGRPDMAYWNFLARILDNTPINLYGETGGARNFTYVKDCTELVSRLVNIELDDYVPINVASDKPKPTIEFLNGIANAVGRKPNIHIVERPLVDVEKTWANVDLLTTLIGEVSPTPMNMAISNFAEWFMLQRAR